MNIAAWELTLPHTMFEIEQRAARALHRAPTPPAPRFPARWLRALRARRG